MELITVSLGEVLHNQLFRYKGTWYYWFHVVTEKHIVMAVPENGGEVVVLPINTLVLVNANSPVGKIHGSNSSSILSKFLKSKESKGETLNE